MGLVSICLTNYSSNDTSNTTDPVVASVHDCIKSCTKSLKSTVTLQTDPHLSRTVVVSTKLDTRLPQFARGSDVEMFLRPPGRLLEPGMLGGCPFFT